MVAARPEAEVETLWRTGHILKKPNWLGVVLDRTAEELAAEILRHGLGQS
jgi:hypothetical protein